MRNNSTLAVIVLSAGVLNMQNSCGDAWPQRRGPLNNGISSETDWSNDWGVDGPSIAWKAQVGVGFSGLSVAGSRAFTMGNAADHDSVIALESTTGAELWRFAYPEALNSKMYEGGPNSTPTIDGDLVFSVSRSGKVHTLDAASGVVRWQVDLPSTVGKTKNDWGVSGSPLVMGDRVFINYGNGATALERSSGKVLWTMGGGDRNSFCTPVLVDDSGADILLLHMKKELIGVRPRDGTRVFKHSFGKGFETHCADPVALPQGVFISSGDDGGERLSIAGTSAQRIWKNPNLGTFTGTAVYRDGYLYGLDAAAYKRADQQLRCVSVNDGSIAWSLSGYGQGSLIAAGDRLIVLSDQGELSVVRATPTRGEVLATAQVLGGKCWTQPSLADGRLYVRNAKGDVVCLKLKS